MLQASLGGLSGLIEALKPLLGCTFCAAAARAQLRPAPELLPGALLFTAAGKAREALAPGLPAQTPPGFLRGVSSHCVRFAVY